MSDLVQDRFSAVFGDRRGIGLPPRPCPSGQERIAESLRMVSDLVEETGEGITLVLGEALHKIEEGWRVDPEEQTIRISEQDGIIYSTTSVEALLGPDGDAGTWAHLLEIAANGEQHAVKVLSGEYIQALSSTAVAEQLAWCLLTRWEWLQEFLPVQDTRA